MTRALLLTTFVFCVSFSYGQPSYAGMNIGFGFGGDDHAKPSITPVQGAPASFADLSAQLLPAVVNISTSQKGMATSELPDMPEFPPGSPFEDFFQEFMDKRGNGDGIQSPQTSLGSGFIVDAAKGIVVTNNHVIKGADQVRVILHGDHTLPAKILGTDEKTDLAVLQIDVSKIKVTAVPFGNSDQMRVGDWILAIGNPFGLGGTVTAGIISARARDINSGPYDDFIQTDASINRGNSGGPMFNMRGEVIGINTAIFSPSGGSVGIGFAIPSNLAKPVVDQIIQYGRTKRGWIGVRIQSVTDEIAESLNLGDIRGALVAGVTPKGPAEKAGLKPGDVVVSYNSLKLDAMKQLPRLVAETPVDTKAKLDILRDGNPLTLTITVAELEKAEDAGLIAGKKKTDDTAQAEPTSIPALGLKLGIITAQDRDDLELPDGTNGVIVMDVTPGSDAQQQGIEVGDIIAEVNQKQVRSPTGVQTIVKKSLEEEKTSVLLLVDAQGKGDVRFVALKLKK